MKKSILLFVLICVGVLLLNGCGIFEIKPNIKELKLTSEILPAVEERSIDMKYTIENGLSFSFQGEVEIVFDKDCLNIVPSEREVLLDSKKNMPFSSTIEANVDRRGDIDDKCFGEQEISVVLYDKDKKNILSHKSIILTVTKS